MIRFKLDGIGLKFDLVGVHITFRLDVATCDITLGDAKVILQRYEHRLIEHFAYVFDVHERFVRVW